MASDSEMWVSESIMPAIETSSYSLILFYCYARDIARNYVLR
jgi:hypothetical protein